MQTKVMKSRKQLTVEFGPSAAELAAQKAESTPPEGTDFEHAEVAGESEVVRRFFQVRLLLAFFQLLCPCWRPHPWAAACVAHPN